MALSIALWVAITPTLDAQEPASTFIEQVDVRVINLEVVVTDRDGARVAGLGPEDFEIEVDGDPVSIDYFTEVADGQATGRAAADGLRGAPATRDGEAVPRRLLIFLDGAFGIPAGFQAFERSLLEQARTLEPGEEITLVFYDGRKLRVLGEKISSAEALERSLARLGPDDFRGAERVMEYRNYQRSMSDEASYTAELSVYGDEAVRPLADVPEYAVTKKRLERQIERTARAIVGSLHHYGDTGADGRKAAILWSGGWPWSSFEMLRPRWSRDLATGRRSENALRGIADTANRLGYTLYMADSPVDAWGGRAEAQHHDTLTLLAEATGGRAFKNRHSLEALDLAREDLRSFYWIGLDARAVGDGDRKKIRVKSRRRGLDVRTRESWLDLEETERIDQKVEALAFFNAASGSDADAAPEDASKALDLRFGEPTVKRRKALVPLSVGIPLEAITMLPSDAGYTATLEVRVSVIDEDGSLNDLPAVPLEFSGPEPGPGDFFYYDTQLELRRKSHEITVAVYDTASGTLLTGRGELTF